jgi:hypothetical protein
MKFLVIDGFDIPSGKNREFQEWVRANAMLLSEAAPEGVEFVGIYVSMYYSGDKQIGGGRIIWRLDSYGAQDRFAAAARGDTEFARLLEEFGSFTDVRLGAGFSRELLKSVADITIWSDQPEE